MSWIYWQLFQLYHFRQSNWVKFFEQKMSGGWKKQVQEDAKTSTFPVSWLRHAIKLWTWQQSSEITKKSSCYLGHIYMRNSFLRSFPNCIRIGCKKCIEYNYIISDCANPIPSQFSWCCQRLLATGSLPGSAGLQKYPPCNHIYNICKYLQYIQQ